MIWPFGTVWTVPSSVAQGGPSQAEVLDHALDAGDSHQVARVVLVLDHDEDARQPVARPGSARQNRRRSRHAEAGNGRTDVDRRTGRAAINPAMIAITAPAIRTASPPRVRTRRSRSASGRLPSSSSAARRARTWSIPTPTAARTARNAASAATMMSRSWKPTETDAGRSEKSGMARDGSNARGGTGVPVAGGYLRRLLLRGLSAVGCGLAAPPPHRCPPKGIQGDIRAHDRRTSAARASGSRGLRGGRLDDRGRVRRVRRRRCRDRSCARGRRRFH